MDYNLLANYGILGLWTGFLIWEKLKFQKEIIKVLEENTNVMIQISNQLNIGRLINEKRNI